ncbi:MAG: Phosphoserine phosphatase 1 [Deltaproteobacteria bacterium ADurb.Bin151]|jgi:broad specificity phosphatase PhoE/predicted kinase|nr:6-phosphofructo-2-kinase/fructose-2,6-bisphosphatase [Smithella sp.]OQB57291.1 MAG: Phosphoserine phosphatase 1 [Deltaproteobacteria bacterium ADurb.Bin151]HNZ09801.1 6-phosphofructo-2-kinase/fructose-2,6-bisphosphatase [Smithellaceae bacterium]HOG81267.1 6-phosphofructo-2-kinase/fructose-2,6-bisphosphatase [Smithellaceae bacterium]HQP24031.1 6-phosphofructo-2-kinase/fructose-2,6-bisphosphatase [Smithellaceae bacterium]
MSDDKLYIVLMGLPARGKSTLALRLLEAFRKDHIRTRIFNNGNLRRIYRPLDETSRAEFYSPRNFAAIALRDKFARMNMERARSYLRNSGQVAILDATNASRRRRETIETYLNDHPLLFIECINDDQEILNLSILEKTRLPEFSHLEYKKAEAEFLKRIDYYKLIYTPLKMERNFVCLDSLQNRIIKEKHTDPIYLFARLRDYLVTDEVKNLFLIRHTQTEYNLEDRIGGNPGLTIKGKEQAEALAQFFCAKKISYIFTSSKIRTKRTAEAIASKQDYCRIIALKEFDEINAGICEGMTYAEIEKKMPDVFRAREANKYAYAYPEGESYATMKPRIEEGIKKAFFLNRHSHNIMIIGHQAVNRLILSHFLYRREVDVPYIYIPQDRFYHIVSMQNKKLFELKRYDKYFYKKTA